MKTKRIRIDPLSLELANNIIDGFGDIYNTSSYSYTLIKYNRSCQEVGLRNKETWSRVKTKSYSFLVLDSDLN